MVLSGEEVFSKLSLFSASVCLCGSFSTFRLSSSSDEGTFLKLHVYFILSNFILCLAVQAIFQTLVKFQNYVHFFVGGE